MDKQETQTMLNKAYQIINEAFFFGTLPEMEIEIIHQDSVGENIAGKYSKGAKQIVLSENLLDCSIEDQINTVYHEMIHAYCDLVMHTKDFIHDFTDGSCYHTYQFYVAAVVLGGRCNTPPDVVTGFHDVSLRPENMRYVLFRLRGGGLDGKEEKGRPGI